MHHCTENSGVLTDLALSTSRSFQSGYFLAYSFKRFQINLDYADKKENHGLLLLKKSFTSKSVLAEARKEQFKTGLCIDSLGV